MTPVHKAWDLLELCNGDGTTVGKHDKGGRVVLLRHDPDKAEWTAFTAPAVDATPETAAAHVKLVVIPESKLHTPRFTEAYINSESTISKEDLHEGGLHTLHQQQQQEQQYRRVFNKYQVHRSSAHGLGMFATHEIHPAEVILAEKSIWRFGSTFGELLALTSDQSTIIRQLSNCGSLQEFSLPKRYAHRTEEFREIFDIYNTNHFEGAGFCPIMAHANHSCEPNAIYMWDPTGQQELLWAVRTIQSGEEILVGYHSDEFDGTEARSTTLRKEKGISQCCCPCCSEPLKHRAERDRKLLRIKELDEVAMPSLLLQVRPLLSRKEAGEEAGEPSSLVLIIEEVIEVAEEALGLCKEVGSWYHTRRIAHDVCQALQAHQKMILNTHQQNRMRELTDLWYQRYASCIQKTKPQIMWTDLEKSVVANVAEQQLIASEYRAEPPRKRQRVSSFADRK